MYRLFLVLLLLLTIRLVNAQPQHEYVDLGLPSGTLWATRNIGDEKYEGECVYFSWGATLPIPYSVYYQDPLQPQKKHQKRSKVYGGMMSFNHIYKYYKDGDRHKITKYCSLSEYGNEGYTDTLSTLERIDDAASILWGEDWCIPTKDQWEELLEQCTWKHIWKFDLDGYEVIGESGQSIFLPESGYRSGFGYLYVPAEGCYWSSSLNTTDPSSAYSIYFDSEKIDSICTLADRPWGLTIRPVRRVNVE